MPGKHDIYVFEDCGAFYVTPKVTMVTKGAKKVAIRNMTDHKVRVRFPDGPIKDEPCMIARRDGHSFDLKPKADGIYEYFVDVNIARGVWAPALAGSWPKIIVDA
jgi:hypothetical protein